MAKFYEFAVVRVEEVWKIENLFQVAIVAAKDILLARFEVFIEEYECSLIVEIHLINDFCSLVRGCYVEAGEHYEHGIQLGHLRNINEP